MQEIINLIEKKNQDLNDSKTKIHAVFYLLSGVDARNFMDYEENMFKLLLEKYKTKIHLYFIITKIQNLEKYKNYELPFVINNFKKVTGELNIDRKYKKNLLKYIFYVNVIGENLMGIKELFGKVYDDFKGYIIEEEINKENISKLTDYSLIGKLNNPKDIVEHPTKLCEQINLVYRLMARSIGSYEKGATFLSAAFLRIISNVFGINNMSIDECKRKIKDIGFSIDDKNNKKRKKYKSYFGSFYYKYQTPAEEEISYLADKYIEQYKFELQNDDYKCLEYINKLRIAMNNSIESLNEISKEYNY